MALWVFGQSASHSNSVRSLERLKRRGESPSLVDFMGLPMDPFIPRTLTGLLCVPGSALRRPWPRQREAGPSLVVSRGEGQVLLPDFWPPAPHLNLD